MHIKRMLYLAEQESKKSTYYQPIGAIFINGNKILSRGYNQLRHKAIGGGMSGYTAFSCSLHAERDCLSKLKKERIRGGTLIIYRGTKAGDSALARPCRQCMWMLTELGVRRVVYSTGQAPYFEELKL